MKKINYVICMALIAILAINCDPPILLKKPFVIIYKFPKGASCNEGYCSYEYIDANGSKIRFCEDEKAYMIGDTIK